LNGTVIFICWFTQGQLEKKIQLHSEEKIFTLFSQIRKESVSRHKKVFRSQQNLPIYLNNRFYYFKEDTFEFAHILSYTSRMDFQKFNKNNVYQWYSMYICIKIGFKFLRKFWMVKLDTLSDFF